MTRLGVARALIGDRFVCGDVEVDDGRVIAVGLAGPGAGTAAPGFVDLQVNGFAGVDLLTADCLGYARAGAALAGTGVTAYQPTFITGDPDATIVALERLDEIRALDPDGPRLLGAHLEGPFLSPARAGTHPMERLREPEERLVERLLAAGTIGMVTLAPELPGALGLVQRLVAAGVVASCGHTDADAAMAVAAFDRGASAVTHLYNAMRPFTHRDPGIVGVALTRAGVTLPLIVDGIHLTPEAVQLTWSAARGRVALVTDAVAAAAMPDGHYRLGEVEVEKVGHSVRRADGTLAGSALTMDAAIRRCVDIGIALEDALHAASTAPSHLLGLSTGQLVVGAPADIVVLTEHLDVRLVLRDGVQIA